MNHLDKILKVKKEEIDLLPKHSSVNRLFPKKSLLKSLRTKRPSIIAEIKFKSPSEGWILKNGDPLQIAKDYELAGADAISVLTDKRFFGGELKFIEEIKRIIDIPVLQKDFFISKRQILKGFNKGADSFLLIIDAVSKEKAKNLIQFSEQINTEALAEFHSFDHIELINELKPKIIGVNCRDLKSMKTDLNYFQKVYDFLPTNSVKVAESGFTTSEQIKEIYNLGFDAFLIGTSLMRSGSPGKKLEEIIRGLN